MGEVPLYRFRANPVHISQSWPDYGVGFQVKVRKTFQVVPSSLGEPLTHFARTPAHAGLATSGGYAQSRATAYGTTYRSTLRYCLRYYLP